MDIGTSSTEITKVKGELALLISRLLHFDQSCEKQLHVLVLINRHWLNCFCIFKPFGRKMKFPAF